MPNLIPREFITELLARSDLVELIDARVPLRKKGGNYLACCPFHQEKTPSFTVSPSKQFYHCFGCGASGNAIGFLMEYDRFSFVEAVEQLAKQQGMEIPQQLKSLPAPSTDLYALMEQAASYYQQQLRAYPPAISYLKSRGLTGKIAKEFGIGYAPPLWDGLLKHLGTSADKIGELVTVGLIIKKNEGGHYDRFRDRIMYPIRDRRGRVIGFGGRTISQAEPKYLNSPESPLFHKGNELYGLYEVCQVTREMPWLLVVEGYMDTVALAQHGIHTVVATLGTATTAEHIQRLFRLTNEIIFCFDGDRAGQAAAWRALEVLLPHWQDGRQVRFLILPQGEDPDSAVRREGPAQFAARITGAQSLGDFLFAHFVQQVDLSLAEGRARLAKLMVPYLQKLPEGVFQHILFERLASLVRMEVGMLKELTREKGRKKPVAPVLQQRRDLRRSPMRLAIALLLQHPHLVQSLTDITAIVALSLPGSALLQELISHAQQSLDLNTGTLLEYWRGRPEFEQLQRLASLELNLPANGIESEFLGVLDKLLRVQSEGEVEQLMQKGTLEKLTAVEKTRLQELIAAAKR